MILTDKSATPRELHPAGWTRAVSIRVIDLGMQNGFQGKAQHKCRILFETEHRYTEGDNKGKRFLISDKLTASLSEKANLRKVLEQWRSKPFTAEEAAGFDTAKLNGVPAYLNIMHKTLDNGNTIAVIAAYGPLPKGMEPLVQETPFDYTPEWVQKEIDGRLDK